MNFVPEQPEQEAQDAPFFEDVTGEGGWQGHTTGKSVDTLKAEIIAAITRLGGLVTGFQRGTFLTGDKKRDGFQVHYTVERSDGSLYPGRLDVAALPVEDDYKKRRSLKTRKEKSLRMALFMLREALDGAWFLRMLSPGYAPLMPWMLDNSGRTVSQLWSEGAFAIALPAGETSEDILEGEFIEDED